MTVYELVQQLLEYNPDIKILVAGKDYEEKGLTEPVLRFYEADEVEGPFFVIETK